MEGPIGLLMQRASELFSVMSLVCNRKPCWSSLVVAFFPRAAASVLLLLSFWKVSV